MARTGTRIYTSEFRAEAVKLVLEQGIPLQDAALKLSLPKGTLANWLTAVRQGGGSVAPIGSRRVAELEAENAKLRSELHEVKVERDIIKKAAAYFARESLPGTR
jgi:transposase